MAYQGNRGGNSRGKFGGGGRSGAPKRGGRRGGGTGGPKKQQIHPSKFIKAAQPQTQEEYKNENTFADFKVKELLAKNVAKKGFVNPSPIQDQSIPVGLAGTDVIGIANTGTGKTIAFGIPAINRLMENKESRVIIMAPTRELAHQIQEELETLTHGSDIKSVLLIGGMPMHRQLTKLKLKPRMVIGTPGRIKDHLEQGKLKLHNFDTVVLDEVDRMLDMGFVNDMRVILGRLPKERQSFFFSATMEDRVGELIKEFSNNPQTISVKTGNTSDSVEQDIVRYSGKEDQIEKLHALLVENRNGKTIIFDDMKHRVNKLSEELVSRGFKSDAIHGNKTQGQRQRALNGFKQGKTNILVATDVAARGIDVEDVTLLVNYSTPQTYDDYTHRVGRAGRAGKTGKALTFIEGKEGGASSSTQSSRPKRDFKPRDRKDFSKKSDSEGGSKPRRDFKPRGQKSSDSQGGAKSNKSFEQKKYYSKFKPNKKK